MKKEICSLCPQSEQGDYQLVCKGKLDRFGDPMGCRYVKNCPVGVDSGLYKAVIVLKEVKHAWSTGGRSEHTRDEILEAIDFICDYAMRSEREFWYWEVNPLTLEAKKYLLTRNAGFVLTGKYNLTTMGLEYVSSVTELGKYVSVGSYEYKEE